IAIESASGKDKKGVIESASAEQAALDLKSMGLLPTSVTAAGGGLRVPAAKTGSSGQSGAGSAFTAKPEPKAKKKGAPMTLGATGCARCRRQSTS
ncbi:MAG: hypothetical protein ACK54L_14885, partial [Betaproteobacteria bacterium]